MPAIWVEKETFRLRLVPRSIDGPAPHVWGERPHDSVVAPKSVTVIVVMHNGDLHGHAVEVHHTIDHQGGEGGGNTWKEEHIIVT